MVWLSVALVLSVAIASLAYVWPKVAFLAMQGQVIADASEREKAQGDLFSQFANSETPAAGDANPYL